MSTRESILAHMNKDHKISLTDYLGHYNGIKLDPLSNKTEIQLTDLQLDSLTIKYKAKPSDELKEIVIPIEPAMNSLSDSRVVLVKMAYTSAKALGYSPYQVKDYIGPKGLWDWTLLAVRAIAALPAFVPDSTIRAFVLSLGGSEDLADTLVVAKLGPILATIGLNVSQLGLGIIPLINKYRVPKPARNWWIASTLVEGPSAVKRLKAEGDRIDSPETIKRLKQKAGLNDDLTAKH